MDRPFIRLIPEAVMSEAAPHAGTAAKPEARPVKRRSPVERVVVWGVIAALIVVLGIEGYAKVAYGSSLSSLQKKLNESETGGDFTVSQAHGYVRGAYRRAESKDKRGKQVTYRWFSLFKHYAIQLNASPEDVVLSLETPDAPAEIASDPAPKTAADAAPKAAPTAGPKAAPAAEPDADPAALPKADPAALEATPKE
jgi:hypothetical protein